jgi:hypothetical protein
MMKAINFLVLTSIVLVPVICFAGDDAKLFGDENAATIANPVSVKACQTVGSHTLSPPKYFEKSKDLLSVSTNLAKELSHVLLDEKSYEFSNGSIPRGGLLQPVVAVTYSDGKREVDVFFDFECTVLVVKSQTKEIGNVFSPSRRQIVRIIKKIFPNDSEMQSLKE